MSGTNRGGKNGGQGDETDLRTVRDPEVSDELDIVFGLLQSARRRYILYYLNAMDGAVTTFEETVDAVCAYEFAESDTEEFPPRQPIRHDLARVHIPRLENADIIEYDHRQGTVRFQGVDSVEEWLEHARFLEMV